MVKRLTMLMGGLILSTGIALAQTTVTGKVVSQEDGEPVIGASVRIVGTKTGTATDVDGNFTLPNASKDAVLEISYLGMQTKTMKASAKMKIILASDARNLDEVVVTALGMKRSEKTLGYAASTANASELTVAKSGSLMSGLQGKMAGVQICGIMMMASNTDDEQQIAQEFDEAARFFDEIKARYFADDDAFCERSWGMSHDYHIAVKHGSTMVRVGTTIFGPRIY